MNYILANWFLLSLGINYIIALGAAYFLIKTNQNPHKTLTSLLLLLALPFVGLIIYWFFGLEYRKEKIFKRKDLKDHDLIKNWDQKLSLTTTELEDLKKSTLEDKANIVKLIKNNEGIPVTIHNKVDMLINGERKLESLLKDLSEAQSHIHMEYYILADDTTGQKIFDKLFEARERGVEIRIIYDSVGHEMSQSSINKLKEAGVRIESFMPVLFSRFTRKANYRNHRKIVIIDGKLGYLGGINLSDEYVNSPKNRDGIYWRDTHIRIEGHAVKSMQLQWLLNWYFVSDEELEIEEKYFPELDITEETAVQIAASGPDSDWANIQQAIFIAITNAEERVWITTPYLIPNQAILEALKVAAQTDIDVRIIIPKVGDSWAARYAARSYLEQLLKSGVKIQMYCKGMIHAKTMIVDDNFTTVGTSNMDYRSFNINFEINALIFNKHFNQVVEDQFHKDFKDCEEIVLERWLARPKLEKFKESFCRLWAPML